MSDLLDAITEKNQQAEYTKQRSRAIAEHPLASKVPSLDLGQPWSLRGDWMIVGDVHVPSTDWELAALVAEIAKRHLKRPRRLLIAGDLFNMDKFSHYPHISVPPSWLEERASAEKLLSTWLKTFDELRWFVGNHERRLQRLMVEVLETTDLLSVIIANPDKAKFSNFSYCYIDSGGEEYLVVHPRNYSRNQLTVARMLSEKTGRHVISFHEHHASMGWDHSGKLLIINGGSLINPAQVAYMSLDLSTVPVSKPGFVMLRGGVPTLFGPPPMTDWGSWLRSSKKSLP